MSRFSKIFSALCVVAATFSLANCKTPPSPAPTENGSSVGIEYATFEWKTKNDFKRITEYFSNEENVGGNCVVRSDPDVREGLYFIVGVEAGTTLPRGSTATLHYFRPDKTGCQTQTFTLPEWTSSIAGELRLGLTGDAWAAGKRARPNAWQFSVHAPDGKLLLFRESFLWKHPAQKNAPAKNENAAEKSANAPAKK